MTAKQYLSLIFIFIHSIGFAQNLIENGSFECVNQCPDYIYGTYNLSKKFNNVCGWENSSKGSPDFYHLKCYRFYKQKHINYIKKNNYIHNGEGSVGLVLYSSFNPQKDYREEIKSKFLTKLKTGHTYCVSLYIKPDKKTKYFINGIGIKLISSKKKIVTVTNNIVINNLQEWTKLCFTFIATGKEKYIAIGRFKAKKDLIIQENEGILNNYKLADLGAYYYIDDVKVMELTPQAACRCPETTPTDTIAPVHTPRFDTLITLHHIHFAHNKSYWDDSAAVATELNRIVQLLQRYPEAHILIKGHTDNTGIESRNIQLSEQRAKAVAQYLIKQGIAANRITYKGYGASEPVADNKTEKGRMLNRRVEIRLSTP